MNTSELSQQLSRQELHALERLSELLLCRVRTESFPPGTTEHLVASHIALLKAARSRTDIANAFSMLRSTQSLTLHEQGLVWKALKSTLAAYPLVESA